MSDSSARIDPSIIRRWAASMTGAVILPHDDVYDSARRVWNLAIDRRPAAIVRCGAVDDVRRAVELARTHDLPLAIRSGGHSQAGLGVCDGGVVIDLAAMRAITVNPERRTVHVAAGARVADVVDATEARRLLTPMGGCPDVGVGGLTLGGGENFLMARYGAVVDNVVSAEVVTVDGDARTASAREHSDLFWALRGGGGNFGIVTAFAYGLHDIGDVLSGQMLFAPDRTREVMRRYRDLMAAAPDELTTSGGLTFVHGEPFFFIAVCVCGERKAAEGMLHRWRGVLRPDRDNIDWAPYSADLVVPAAASVGSGLFLPALADEVIEAFAAAVADAPPSASAVWNDFHGAVTRVAADATAFPLRSPGWDLFISVPWDSEPSRTAALAWSEKLTAALRPFSRGVYVNNLNETERDRVREAYQGNYDRLATLKARYDPENVLRVNHNIPPGT